VASSLRPQRLNEGQQAAISSSNHQHHRALQSRATHGIEKHPMDLGNIYISGDTVLRISKNNLHSNRYSAGASWHQPHITLWCC
jgi:hypothetical protein